MPLEKEFEKWLNEALAPLGLNDEVYVNYVQGIMEESTTPVDDKIEGIVDFLAAATVNIFIRSDLNYKSRRHHWETISKIHYAIGQESSKKNNNENKKRKRKKRKMRPELHEKNH